MTYSKKVKEQFIELRAGGTTLAQAARDLNIAYNTAVDWQKEFLEEINARKAIELEELMARYRMTKEKRIELLGEKLLAVQKELDERDLSEIPTPRLFEMMIRLSKTLETEAINPEFMNEADIRIKKTHRKDTELRFH